MTVLVLTARFNDPFSSQLSMFVSLPEHPVVPAISDLSAKIWSQFASLQRKLVIKMEGCWRGKEDLLEIHSESQKVGGLTGRVAWLDDDIIVVDGKVHSLITCSAAIVEKTDL